MPVERVEHDGVIYELELSNKPSLQNGGYVGVFKPGNHYHSKITIFKGEGQTTLPGPGCKTAKEAALRLAMYKEEPYEIEKKNPDRAAMCERKALARCAHAIAPAPAPCCSPRLITVCLTPGRLRTETQSCSFHGPRWS